MSTKPHHGNVNRRDDFPCDVKVTCHNMASRFSMHSENAHVFREYETLARISLSGEQRVHSQKKCFLVVIRGARVEYEIKDRKSVV